MKDTNIKTIGDIITEFVAQNHRTETLKDNQALAVWHEICGEFIHSHCTKVYVKRGIIYIFLDNSALKNELVMRKSSIINKINQRLTIPVIKDVIIK